MNFGIMKSNGRTPAISQSKFLYISSQILASVPKAPSCSCTLVESIEAIKRDKASGQFSGPHSESTETMAVPDVDLTIGAWSVIPSTRILLTYS